MERSLLFYALFGALVVIVPGISDRLLNGRVAEWQRIVIGFVVAALTGVVLVLAAGPLGL